MSAVVLGIHLQGLGFDARFIGVLLTVGLLSAALAAVAAAWISARIGRRATLATTGALMAIAGADLALARSPALLLLAALTGMVGTANVDFGAFASIEQAALTESVEPQRRNLAFARYSLTGGLAGAAGALTAALATDLNHSRALFVGYAAIGVLTALLPLQLSKRIEAPLRAPALTRDQARRLAPLSGLLFLDSVGGGLVGNAVIAYWLHIRFGASPAVLGPAFAVIALLQSASYEISGRLANRIGLIRTMVFTHAPSNILLTLVPLMPSLPLAIALLFARFSLSQMDVPARQAFVVSIVPPAERAGALGLTGLVRGLGQASEPIVSGIAIQAAALGLPFYLAGGLKLLYDATLFGAFRNRRGEHELIA
jgi:MFS family permease